MHRGVKLVAALGLTALLAGCGSGTTSKTSPTTIPAPAQLQARLVLAV